MVKILANDGIEADGQLLLEEADYEVDTQHVPQEDLPKVLPDYDVIIVRSATKVRKELIDLCPKLKIIARGGVGMDNIDVEYARSKGIAVINTPNASSQSVAELAFAHIFTLARSLHMTNRLLPESGATDFKKLKSRFSDGIQLRGKTLGIIGFGRIGQELARIALALGMNIKPVDVALDEAELQINVFNNSEVGLTVRLKTYDMEEVLRTSDFISLHVPGGCLIGKTEIEMMKTGSYIINTARGGVVDEDALFEALESGKLAGAGLDVFMNEPTPRADLMNHPKVSVSPHIGASTLEAQVNIGMELADRIIEFFGD